MQKIISLFQRNYESDRLVRDEIVPGAEWVMAGEGIATRKWDGMACRIHQGRLYRRLELKAGRTPPLGFEPCQEADLITGARPGWLLVGDGPEDKWLREAAQRRPFLEDGTYEAVGPHFGGGSHIKNPECRDVDMLERHGNVIFGDVPRSFAGIRDWLASCVGPVEGIVFHHPDGRMVKVKRKDFGLK